MRLKGIAVDLENIVCTGGELWKPNIKIGVQYDGVMKTEIELALPAEHSDPSCQTTYTLIGDPDPIPRIIQIIGTKLVAEITPADYNDPTL